MSRLRRFLCAFTWHSWRGVYMDAGWLVMECLFCGRMGARRA